MFTMACSGQTDNIYYTSNPKNIPWYEFSQSRSCHLSRACRVHNDLDMINIQQSDKMTILLRFNNVYSVYRKRDGSVAILHNVTFKQSNPPTTMEITPRDGIVDGIEITLMYAEALRDWTHTPDIKFHRGDIVLILADIKKEEYVGLTGKSQVGVFPSAIVKTITKPRRLLMGDVIIKMKDKNIMDAAGFPMNPAYHTHEKSYSYQELDSAVNKTPDYFSLESSLYLPPGGFPGNRTPYYFPTDDPKEFHTKTKKELKRHSYIELDDLYATSLPRPVTAADNGSQLKRQEKGDSQRDHWFKGRMSRGAAEKLLTDEGDYLFRYRSDNSNAIVMSICTEGKKYQHIVIFNEDKNEQILHDITPEVEERILVHAKSTGLPFQDNKPIRLGGKTKEQGEQYESTPLSAERNSLLYKRDGLKLPGVFNLQREDNGRKFAQGEENQDALNFLSERGHFAQGEENQDALNFLSERGHLEVSRALYEDVADYLTEDRWEEFGIVLKIPPNTRRHLEREFGDIRDRTTALLNVWHQIRGQKATILKLIEALQEVKLKEITSLLEYMRDTLQVEDHSNV